jgi:hypothetical protein
LDDNPDLEKQVDRCPEYPKCVYRIELLEKWKEGAEKKLDGLYKLLLANLSGVVLTLVSGIIALVIFIATKE